MVIRWAAAALVFALAGGASSALAFQPGHGGFRESGSPPATVFSERQVIVPAVGGAETVIVPVHRRGRGRGHGDVIVLPRERFFFPRERIIVVPRERVFIPREHFFAPRERLFVPRDHVFFGDPFPRFHRGGIQLHLHLAP